MSTADAATPIGRDALAFARDVRNGLLREGQKELPPTYLYDDLGSALFEAICLLPEYGLTRASERLVERHAHDYASGSGSRIVVVDLGSGSGRKTRAALAAVSLGRSATYHPIDVSRRALDRSAAELAGIPGLVCAGIEAPYLEGLESVTREIGDDEELIVLFLGSTIGNFERAEGVRFLRSVGERMRPGDRLLLEADLEKPVPQLLLAYDDPAGVTAAFDLNVLGRINRELGGDFDLRRFRHEARWSTRARRVEMHLLSLARQRVTIEEAGVRVELAAGETIWTESSHRFAAEELLAMGARGGFTAIKQWIDGEWPFAQTLLARARPTSSTARS